MAVRLAVKIRLLPSNFVKISIVLKKVQKPGKPGFFILGKKKFNFKKRE